MFKTNIMSFNTPLTCGSIPAREKSNKSNKVFHGLSNQQMGNKLQREVSNPRPLTILSFDTMLNNQLSEKLKLVGFRFDMNIMSFNTLFHMRAHTRMWRVKQTKQSPQWTFNSTNGVQITKRSRTQGLLVDQTLIPC